jgi:hypothetical protein
MGEHSTEGSTTEFIETYIGVYGEVFPRIGSHSKAGIFMGRTHVTGNMKLSEILKQLIVPMRKMSLKMAPGVR